MKTLVAVLFFVVMFFASSAHAQNCHFGGGVGQASIGVSSIENLGERFLSSEYSRVTSDKRSTSTTWELFFGCVISEDYGLKAEFGVHHGFKHFVRSNVLLSYDGRTEDFSIDWLARARAYRASVDWEGQLSQKSFFIVELGVWYVEATADVFPTGSEFSIHTEDSGFVPVIGLGLRFEVDDHWSAVGKCRLIGHPDVSQCQLSFQYALKPLR